ncbi:MAG: RluA family pseudouridine synthase [Bdellovibrionales bacterium]|nr:RluA family pseudouridine synthase [Bdellovibrionales bacterium]
MRRVEFTIEKVPEDPRLDKAIPLHHPEVSRGQARRLIENGSVYVNGKRCHQNAREVRTGDVVHLLISDAPKPKNPERAAGSITAGHIIFENADLVVVNKPAGLPTHATIDTSRHHLVEALQEFLGARGGVPPSQVYLGVHHRLDRDTSGVILFTKRKEANAAIAQAFQGREVEKDYLAVCLGEPRRKEFTVKTYMDTDRRNKRRMAVVARGGKHAETQVEHLQTVWKNNRKISLVKASPVTGRMHQIRVHLAHEGLPLLGDKTYGVEFPGVERVMLHAWRLRVGGQEFIAPFPDDFRSIDFTPPV